MLPLFQKFNTRICSGLQFILIAIFFILVIDVLWGVASRYLLGSQAAWSEELARLLMVWLALLGTALACREQQHLGLDIIVNRWPDGLRRLAFLFVNGAILFFAAVVMAWGGFHLVRLRFESGQTLPALGLAKAWFYLALPVSGVFMSFFAVESFWEVLTRGAHGFPNGEEKE